MSCVTGLGGLYLEGLIHRGAYFRNFTVYMLAGIKQSISFLVDRIKLSLTYRPCAADEVEWKMNKHCFKNQEVSDDAIFRPLLLVDGV